MCTYECVLLCIGTMHVPVEKRKLYFLELELQVVTSRPVSAEN